MIILDRSNNLAEKASPPSLGRRPMRVCLASMAPFVGGAEVAAERLAIGLQEAGHDVVLFLGQSGAVQDRLEKAGLRCIVSPMYLTDKWHWWRYRRARQALRKWLCLERADVVHSNDLPTHQIVSDAAKELGIPRICHHRFPFPGKAIDWLNKFGAERHLFVSHALMDEMCCESTRLASSSRTVVYDGLFLPPAPTPAARIETRSRLGLPTDRVIVLFAGQIIERKGVGDLIQAWALLGASVRKRAELVIVGDDLASHGAYRKAMARLDDELGVRARFLGFQKNVGEWLLASDIAAVPSHLEPLGNATLEAMAYGLPVIGGHVGGIPEMILHGQTGLLIRPRDPAHIAEALNSLINSPSERSRLGAAARQRCEDYFSLRNHVHSMELEYGRIIQNARPVRLI